MYFCGSNFEEVFFWNRSFENILFKKVSESNFENVFFEGAIFRKQSWKCILTFSNLLSQKKFWESNFENVFFEGESLKK